MEQHPIPRQITSFEFKLIGFMTLKQFLYLVVAVPAGFLVFKLFPIPLLNILLAAVVVLAGVAFAFFPINDRPLDIWLRNLLKRLTSPTQYFYKKDNPPIRIFQDLYFVADPHRIMAHIESQQKLAAYLTQTKQRAVPDKRKKAVQSLIQGKKMPAAVPEKPPAVKVKPLPPASNATPLKTTAQPKPVVPLSGNGKQPFFIGVVKNNRKIPLPGIMVYIKDDQSKPVRLLRTNPHGVFATYNSLPKGEYWLEPKDPRETYFFDTMKIGIEDINTKPIEVFSKELL